MVEKIIQKDEEEKPGEGNRLFRLPKHIKQLGLGGNCPEIYIEDYAEGYLRRLAGSDYTECRVAVLVGEFIKSEGKRYVFVRGAIEVEDVMVDHAVQFTSELWAGVYEKIKRYFPQYEAVGWFLGGPEFLTEITDHIRQVHVDWFGGRDRVLYKIDPVEKEALFYLYDKGELKQWPGYCVYYEKNEEMQEYLVAGAQPSVDAGYEEPVLTEFNKRVGRTEDAGQGCQEVQSEVKKVNEPIVIQGKKKAGKTNSGPGAGIAAAVLLLAIGAFALRDKELGGLNNAEEPTPMPAPTAIGYLQMESREDIVQTNAQIKSTEQAVIQGNTEGGVFDREFVAITEEPYEPGRKAQEQQVTSLPEEPTSVPTAVPEKEEEVVQTDELKLYIVQRGDTLAGICRLFYGTISRMEEIKGINQIPDENRIYAGQELYLP